MDSTISILNYKIRTNLEPILDKKKKEVVYFEEKSLNSNSHRSIYYSITLSKFFSLRFQQLRQMKERVIKKENDF